MKKFQEKLKSLTKPPTIPSRGATSSSSREACPPSSMPSIPFGNIPLNAPTQEESKPIQNELDKNAQREKFLKDYPKAAKMLENIKIGENNKNLETLKQEFIKSGFVYSMAPTSPDDFLKGTKQDGDCSTLAKAYVKIANEYLGIENVKVDSKREDFFVPNGGKVLDMNKATGNVDKGKHWVFTNHYWVESPIGTIDLLFLGQEVNQSQWIDKTGEGKQGEVEYRIFKDHKVYESNYMTLADRYATDLDEAQKGSKEAAEAAEAAMRVKPKQSPNLLKRVRGY